MSRKFYESACRQIHVVSTISGDIDEGHLIKCLDEYIDRGRVEAEFTDVEQVVFTLLQPQIDKALERSRRARVAAARRHKANVQVESEDVATLDESIITASVQATLEDSPESERVLNKEKSFTEETPDETGPDAPSSPSPRDEKRARRRETALARRLAKRQKRLSRRGRGGRRIQQRIPPLPQPSEGVSPLH